MEEQNTKQPKMGFFKMVGNSITKIEKYPEMAAQGLGKAVSYLAKIIAILAIVLSLGMMYQAHGLMKEGIAYLQNEFPEFSYKDGVLDIQSEEPIRISAEDSVAGLTIIDTKVEDESQINQYINEITQEGEGILVLKDKITVKTYSVAGTISYLYKDMLEPMGITEFVKQDVINYANSNQVINVYISLFITIFIYAFIMYFLTTLSNAIVLSLFGFIASWIARIKMRYVAIFNMSVYALTLSTILNMIYIAVNSFIPFTMEYFQVMYVAVAAIYLVAAIFILKDEFIKKQIELMKIAEAEAIVKKQMEEKEQEEKDKKEKEERKKKDEEEKKKEEKENKKEDEKNGGEPQGSNA